MPDLPTRSERERQIAAALVLLFGQWEDRPWDAAAFRSDAQRALAPILAEAYGDSAAQMLAAFPVDTVGDSRTQGQRWAAGFAGELAAEIAAATPGMGKGAFTLARAEMIAVTETTRAAVAAETAIAAVLAGLAGESGGKTLEPIWYTALDERVCPICQPLHGTGRRVWERPAPDGPPAHPRCRCWLTWESV